MVLATAVGAILILLLGAILAYRSRDRTESIRHHPTNRH
jgi:hypothetical protein